MGVRTDTSDGGGVRRSLEASRALVLDDGLGRARLLGARGRLQSASAGRRLGSVLAPLGAVVVLLFPASAFGASASQSFVVVGEHQFVVPAGVTSVNVRRAGGNGGAGLDSGGLSGGLGATVSATLAVAPDETLFAEVAGDGQTGLPESTAAGGYGGGGPGSPGGVGVQGGSSGGGGSDVRRCSIVALSAADPALCATATTLGSRLVVAGGGGAGGSEGDGSAVGGQGWKSIATGLSEVGSTYYVGEAEQDGTFDCVG